MSIKYEQVFPWGRNFDEYCHMFDLNKADLHKKILGCGDGPASFNAECNASDGKVVSFDPIYEMSKEQLSKRIDETFKTVIDQTIKNQDKFLWNKIKSIEELGKIRMNAMKAFLEDFETGKSKGSYIAGALPALPFENDSFDIALSSHFLFLYSDNLTYDFHEAAIGEMLRVAKEVRIFPLLDVNARQSSYLKKIIVHFKGLKIETRKVDYEFQIGGNEVLIISNV